LNTKRLIQIVILVSVVVSISAGIGGFYYIVDKHPWIVQKFKQIFTCTEKDEKESSSKIKNDSYQLHRKAAKQTGLKAIQNDEQLNSYKKEGKLIQVNNLKGYKIGKLTHSKAVLTPETYKTLQEIGLRFSQKAGNGNYFVVTSMTRTVKDQKKLTKNNVNATKNMSTHCYGCSFDISYIRFNGKKGNNKKLQDDLESILIDYQKDKRIYIVVEKRMHCYHITVIPTLKT